MAYGINPMIKVMLFVLTALSLAGGAFADDVWVLQGFAQGAIDVCRSYRWRGDVLFHNAAPLAARIRLIEVSNGAPPTFADRELTLAGNRSTSLALENKAWQPNPIVPIWVTHLDVPQAVTVESRILVGLDTCTAQPPADGIFGKLSFPVFRSLQPPGTTKIHLGTDLAATSSRNNVAVYNASEVLAHVRIEVRQLCDEAIVDARDVDLAAKSVIQVTGLSTTTSGCANTAYAYMTYVAVTADQPSLSWVSSLTNTDPIKVVYAATSSSP